MNKTVSIRFVKINGSIYLKPEDVAKYITEASAGEGKDTQIRLLKMAHFIRDFAEEAKES
jgi:hypothetical protein